MTVLLFGGCINNQNFAGETQSAKALTATDTVACNIPDGAFSNLPSDVVIGTDVDTINHFKTVASPNSHFRGDLGGATMEVDISGMEKAVRTYNEPGENKSLKTYQKICVNSGRLYGENVRGLFTEKGILWLEMKSDQEFISADMWFFLEKVD